MRCRRNKAEECTLMPGCSGHGCAMRTEHGRQARAMPQRSRSSSARLTDHHWRRSCRAGGHAWGATRRHDVRACGRRKRRRRRGNRARVGHVVEAVGNCTLRVRLIGRVRHGHRRRRGLARTIGAKVKRGVPLVGVLVDASASGDSAKRGAAKRAACDGAQRRAEAGDAVRRTASRHRGRMHFGKGETRVQRWRARRAGCTAAEGGGKHGRCSGRGRRRRETRRRGRSSAHLGWRRWCRGAHTGSRYGCRHWTAPDCTCDAPREARRKRPIPHRGSAAWSGRALPTRPSSASPVCPAASPCRRGCR